MITGMDLHKRFDSLLKRIGGLAAASSLCDIGVWGVGRWRSQGIASKHFDKIVAHTNGAITYDELFAFKKAARIEAKKASKAKERSP